MEWKNDEEINQNKKLRLLNPQNSETEENKEEIQTKAHEKIFEISTKFVEGDEDSLIELEHIITSIGYIPDETYNPNLFQALVEYITNTKLNNATMTSALYMIYSLSIKNAENFVDFVTPQFATFLILSVLSKTYIKSYYSFVAINQISIQSKECMSIFLDRGLLGTIDILLESEPSSIPLLSRKEIDRCSIFNILFKAMQLVDESRFYGYVEVILNELMCTDELRIKMCILNGILELTEEFSNALIEANVHLVIIDLMENSDTCLLASTIMLEIVKNNGPMFLLEGGINFFSYLKNSFNENNRKAAKNAADTLLIIMNEDPSIINEEMISFFVEKSVDSAYEIKVLSVFMICSILNIGIDKEKCNILIDADIIDIFTEIAESEAKKDGKIVEMILKTILSEGTKQPIFSDAVKENTNLPEFLDDYQTAESQEILSIFYDESD